MKKEKRQSLYLQNQIVSTRGFSLAIRKENLWIITILNTVLHSVSLKRNKQTKTGVLGFLYSFILNCVQSNMIEAAVVGIMDYSRRKSFY